MKGIKRTRYFGQLLEFDPNDDSLKIDGKLFTAEKLLEAARVYRGANRLHKPIALLFWIDCKNGKATNWNLH